MLKFGLMLLSLPSLPLLVVVLSIQLSGYAQVWFDVVVIAVGVQGGAGADGAGQEALRSCFRSR